MTMHWACMQLPSEGSVLSPGQPLLKLASHNFQNAVDRNNWQCAAFTCDAEHVAAASASKDAHHLHIWTRWGRLERILEGMATNLLAPYGPTAAGNLLLFGGLMEYVA